MLHARHAHRRADFGMAIGSGEHDILPAPVRRTRHPASAGAANWTTFSRSASAAAVTTTRARTTSPSASPATAPPPAGTGPSAARRSRWPASPCAQRPGAHPQRHHALVLQQHDADMRSMDETALWWTVFGCNSLAYDAHPVPGQTPERREALRLLLGRGSPHACLPVHPKWHAIPAHPRPESNPSTITHLLRARDHRSARLHSHSSVPTNSRRRSRAHIRLHSHLN
jgi:hypothetical protein